MTKDINYYESKLRLNINRIKEELTTQAVMYYEVCSKQIEIRINLDQINNDLDNLKSNLTIDFRNLKPKPTADEIKAKIGLNEYVIKMSDEILKIKADYERWTALRNAYEQRKSTLIKLSELMKDIILNDTNTIKKLNKISPK